MPITQTVMADVCGAMGRAWRRRATLLNAHVGTLKKTTTDHWDAIAAAEHMSKSLELLCYSARHGHLKNKPVEITRQAIDGLLASTDTRLAQRVLRKEMGPDGALKLLAEEARKGELLEGTIAVPAAEFAARRIRNEGDLQAARWVLTPTSDPKAHALMGEAMHRRGNSSWAGEFFKDAIDRCRDLASLCNISTWIPHGPAYEGVNALFRRAERLLK